MKNEKILSLIQDNLMSETEARHRYTPLLAAFIEAGDEKNANKVREIMGDEKNHELILMGFELEYDNRIQIAEDDAKETLSFLSKNVKK